MHDLNYFDNRSELDENGCWVWSLYLNRQGYGSFRFGDKMHLAHRGSYEAAFGPIPEGMTVDHKCFRTDCVNPEHLQLLPLLENQRRQRSSLATHCKNGHEYTEENTYIRPKRYRTGRRDCRKCIAARVRKSAAARKEAA